MCHQAYAESSHAHCQGEVYVPIVNLPGGSVVRMQVLPLSLVASPFYIDI